MPTAEELIKMLNESSVDTYASEPEELVIDAESRSINIPQSERLFGVKGDMNIERKYFRCPKIVGDNIDLSTHQIFIAYVYTERETGSILPSVGVAPYHCEDVEVDGEDITFSWKLTGNVFKNPGFILFKMYAKRTETDPNTVFNTTPAIGTVLATIPDGTEEIKEEYPDVIAQIFDRLDALESAGGGGTGGTTNYENLSNKPQLNGVTLEGNKTLDQVGVLAKNQGASNSGKYLSVGSDGNVVPTDAPSGGTVDPEQIKQAVNGYLEENPVSGMTAEQEQQLNQNTTDVADLKSALPDKLDTNQGSDNVGKSMVVGPDGTITPDIPVTDVADKSVTFEKFSNDIASSSEIGLKYELLKSDMTLYSGWIKFDELVNIIAVFNGTVNENARVYYTDEDSNLDDQNPIYTEYPFYTARITNNSLTVTDKTALKAKYIQISLQHAQDATISVYGLKKEESGQIDLYSKGDSVAPSNKTLEVVGTYNGDIKCIECVPGESYTIEYESLNGRISTGVLTNDIFQQNPTTYPTMSNTMVVEVPQSANAIQIEYWVGKSTTVKVTGKFYGDLTRPSQKLVKENFDENILRYIRENIGGNVSGAVYYNCQDYGVIPGSSDNTDAMQALIDLVHENGGGVIWIPIGVYTFDSANSSYDMTSNITTLLEAKSHVSILGESLSGSVLKVTGNTPQGAGLFCQNSVHSGEILEGCSYQNFTVDMSEAYLTTYTHRGKAFYYSGIKDCVFRDLRLISTPSTSLGIDMLDNVVMDSIYVYEGGRQWTDGGNGGAGIGIGTGKWQNENYIIRNCVCDSCGHFGIFLEDQGIFLPAKDRNYPKGQIITNNVIRNGRNYAIGVRGGKNVLVTGNNVYENKGGIYTDYGAINIVFSNNLIQGCTDAGFNYGNEMSAVNGADYPCENIVITGNTFADNATDIKKAHTPINSQEVNNIFLDTSF